MCSFKSQVSSNGKLNIHHHLNGRPWRRGSLDKFILKNSKEQAEKQKSEIYIP